MDKEQDACISVEKMLDNYSNRHQTLDLTTRLLAIRVILIYTFVSNC